MRHLGGLAMGSSSLKEYLVRATTLRHLGVGPGGSASLQVDLVRALFGSGCPILYYETLYKQYIVL